MKKLLMSLALVMVLVMALSVGGIFYLSRGLDEGTKIAINPVSIQQVEDGIYEGTFDFQRWSNRIQVTVNQGTITHIQVIDDMRFVKDEVRSTLFDSVLSHQSLEVDTVSQATISSKAYLKAIEKALTTP